MTRTGRGELYAALAAIGYGSAYVATAFALRSFGPLPAAVYRSLLAVVILGLLLALARHRGWTVAPPAEPVPVALVRAGHLVVIAVLGGPVFLASMNMAIAGVGATIASFVAGLYAILAAVFAPFILRERLRLGALIGFAAALVGTGLLAELDVTGSDLGGIAWGLAAAVSFALFLVLSRRWARADAFDGITVALATMSATAIGLGSIVLAGEPASLRPDVVAPESLVALGWLAIVATGGQVLAVSSLRLVPASRTAAFLLLNPVSATVLAFALLGERPSSIQVLGGVVVLAGMAAATLQRPGRQAPAGGEPAGYDRPPGPDAAGATADEGIDIGEPVV
jgi:DME family drug/metabolite transporter